MTRIGTYLVALALLAGLACWGPITAHAEETLVDDTSAQLAAAADYYATRALCADLDRLRASVSVYSQEDPIIMRDAPGGFIDYFKPPANSPALVQTTYAGAPAADIALAFLHEHAGAFGFDDPNITFEVKSTQPSHGKTLVRLRQRFAGAEVFGAEVLVHVTADGRIARVWTDGLRTTKELDAETLAGAPAITPQQASVTAEAATNTRLEATVRDELAALADLRITGSLDSASAKAVTNRLEAAAIGEFSEPVLMVLDPRVTSGMGAPRLVWSTMMRSTPTPLVNDRVFVDAYTDETIKTVSQSRFLLSRFILDGDWQELSWYSDPAATILRYESGLPVSRLDPPKTDSGANMNFDGLGQAYNYFYSHHGCNSYNDQGAVIFSSVFYTTQAMAMWDNANGHFYFGTGNMGMADDIVGHEYTHAVLDRMFGKFTNTGESSAIAESLANLWGEFIDWSGGLMPDYSSDDWEIGEDVTGGPIYHMDAPEQDTDFGNGQGRPSFRSSTFWCNDENDPDYAAINAGVGDKLAYLLTDGDEFEDITVNGLGEAVVRDLYWEALNQIPESPDYLDLRIALLDAADALYTSQTLIDVKDSINKACDAVHIYSDEYFYQGDIPGGTSGTGYKEYKSTALATPSDGYGGYKFIPYKVYIPDSGCLLDNGAETAYPLDVIVLSPGAGQNRNLGTGTENAAHTGFIDGIARRWAEAGYIVVCPTYLKRIIPGVWWWEWPLEKDSALRAVTDFLRAEKVAPREYAVDRFRDLNFICNHLDGILNSKANGCYSTTASRLGLAGHSHGTAITLLAAGAKFEVGGVFEANDAQEVDLTQEGFSRVESGPSPFIDADAFLLMSGSNNIPENQLMGTSSGNPAFFGKDYVQRPLMLTMGGDDFILDGNGLFPFEGTQENPFDDSTAAWMNPINKAYGLNHAPSYGIIIDGANHITAVSEFQGVASWDCGNVWDNWLGPLISDITGGNTQLNLPAEQRTSSEDVLLKTNTIADGLIRAIEGIFPHTVAFTEQDEKLRLDTLEEYTKRFWDVYLTPSYNDAANGEPKAFLQQADEAHTQQNQWIYDFGHSSPCAFVIRDASGQDLVQFQNDGNVLMLKGQKFEQATIAQTSAQEFIIRDQSGTIAAKVDESTGNLYIKGASTPEISDLRTTSAPEFVIRDAVEIAQTGNSDKAKIIIDTDGNLKLTGAIRRAVAPGEPVQ